MRVIICGAGQVGYNIAASLIREENDVTIIDDDPNLIAAINDELDAKGMVGHASNPDVLKAAGANDTDMLIAVTSSDEVNMVACQIGNSLFGIPRKIARIRQQVYLKPEWSNLFSRAQMPIDIVISPEVVVAESIFQRLVVSGATYVSELSEGKAFLIGLICEQGCPVLNTPMNQLHDLFPDLQFRVVGITRKQEAIIPEDDDQLYAGDECFLVVKANHLERVMEAFGHVRQDARRIIIAGGGRIGFGLAQLLQEHASGVRIKVLEQNEERAQYLSEHLPGAIVLHGDALDKETLAGAAIDNAEVFASVTNDDESNILGAILSKKYGCKRAISLVNNTVYAPLVGSLGIDSVVSPGETVVARIMRHVRKGRVKGLHILNGDRWEMVEVDVSENSAIANKNIQEIELPKDVMIVALMEGDDLVIPDDEYVIKPDDRVIIMSAREHSYAVERLFCVQVDLF